MYKQRANGFRSLRVLVFLTPLPYSLGSLVSGPWYHASPSPLDLPPPSAFEILSAPAPLK